MQSFNPSTQEAETGRSLDLETILVYTSSSRPAMDTNETLSPKKNFVGFFPPFLIANSEGATQPFGKVHLGYPALGLTLTLDSLREGL